MTRAFNWYAGSPLERSAERRKDPDWLAAALAAPATRLVPLWRNRSLIAAAEGPAPRAVLLPLAQRHAWWQPLVSEPPLLLGLVDGVAWFAADFSGVDDPESLAAAAGSGTWVDLRQVGAQMPAGEAAICAYARGLLWWHQRHRFCGVCGRPTLVEEAGHVRRCSDPACAAPHFPRTDPAVIMLVVDGDRCLLGRQPRFLPGVYSTLAGFVEPGESLEEAVAREVFEEAGIEVGRVSYHSSQPWPFPSSLMLGFYAEARTTTIQVDGFELEDARWFARADLQGEGATRLPRPDSIARRLIEDWLAGRRG